MHQKGERENNVTDGVFYRYWTQCRSRTTPLVCASKFHDTGLGTTFYTASMYAETATSYYLRCAYVYMVKTASKGF